jgi:transposase
MSNFRTVDRGTAYLLPPSVDEWLPADHLARFVVEIVEQLDFSALTVQYRGSGSEAYHPQMLAALMLYGYASGTYSSRKIEQACYDSIAFRYIAANTHPDHDTLCAFRRRFLPELQKLFVQVLSIARQMKLLKLGTIALDGTKVHANASRHNALSHGRASQMEERLKQEVAELLRRAEQTDKAEEKEPLDIPAELGLRATRLEAIAAAKAEIERRAAERLAREQAEYEAKLAAREKKAKDSGKRPGGKPPEPPSGGVQAKDQVNLTDPESRIMPRSGGGGFDQSYNAQAAVDTDSMLIVATRLVDTPADAKQLVPMLEELARLPEELGRAETLLGDAGFFSAANVEHCHQAQIAPLLARRRDQHYIPWYQRLGEPAALSEPANATERMLHRLKTPAGRALYGLRKQTVEPVFGIIKHAMRFRQFLLRGKAKVTGEWQLVSLAYNLKRLHALAPA